MSGSSDEFGGESGWVTESLLTSVVKYCVNSFMLLTVVWFSPALKKGVFGGSSGDSGKSSSLRTLEEEVVSDHVVRGLGGGAFGQAKPQEGADQVSLGDIDESGADGS